MTHTQLEAFEAYLQQTFRVPEGPHKIVYEAANYALLSGGKRLRPLLLLTTADILKAPDRYAMPAALALEMIHTYSLIHDDLPGMDNDDFRRGKPTLHKVYGEGQAILAGDLLLTEAFHLLATAPVPSDMKTAMITTLARSAGGAGMIGGQAIDLQGQFSKRHELETLHQMKTGALIQAAIELAALAADISEAEKRCLRPFGLSLGLAFQIIDDILDVTQAEAKHGHKTSSDAHNHKTTFVTLLGIEGSRQAATTHLAQALDALSPLQKYDLTPLKTLAYTLVHREI